ncbi:MAG: MFS transporter [Dermatophilaceae bacterium]
MQLSSSPQLDRASRDGVRQLTLLVYVLVFLTTYLQVAMVPLLPEMATRYGLSPIGSAIVLVLPSASMMLTSFPAGWLSDRLGPKPVTVAAAALMSGSAIAQALPMYAAIVGGRIAFGVAFGMVWTAALAWLTEIAAAHGGDASGPLGAAVTSGAIGSVVGPALAGVLAERAGMGVPFAAAAVCLSFVVILLATSEVSSIRRRPAPVLAAGVDVVPTSRRGQGEVWPAAVALALSGAVGAVVQLLAPLQLHRGGSTSSTIGVILSTAAIAYIASSSLTVRLRKAMTGLRANALTSLALALTVLPGALGTSVLTVVLVVALTTIPRAAIGTVAYALATRGSGAAGSGTTIGLLNTVWAASQMAAPLGAGMLNDSFGMRVAYGSLVLVTSLVAGALAIHAWTHRQRRGSVVVLCC